ncbi:MAG TPA: glycine cleavage system aminomethyltransferase GcvT [Chloroflexia bacterium]|nr:glycine cleavage system aminomethyltransferase GcvT [Chloroflexia bacterium]
MSDSAIKNTPLNAAHRALGARMVEFGGWEMPVQYKGILEEHRAVRERAGIFDTCHMGEFVVQGSGALPLLQYSTTNDVAKLELGQAQYSYMTNEQGGVEDDCLVYRFPDHHYVVVNAAPLEADFARLSSLADEHQIGDVVLRNMSEDTGKLDVQGPLAAAIVQKFTDTDLAGLKYYYATQGPIGGVPCRISRTGYTGEDGFELFFPIAETERLWNLFVEAGAEPCGLGCRDTLRLESSLPLSGSDVAPAANRNPICAGFGRFVRLDKESDFCGKAALQAFKDNECAEKLINFEVTGRGVARVHYPIVTADGTTVGEVTSGAPAPSLGKNVGMGWVRPDLAEPGTELAVLVRNQPIAIRVLKRPMYKRAR